MKTPIFQKRSQSEVKLRPTRNQDIDLSEISKRGPTLDIRMNTVEEFGDPDQSPTKEEKLTDKKLTQNIIKCFDALINDDNLKSKSAKKPQFDVDYDDMAMNFCDTYMNDEIEIADEGQAGEEENG